MFRKCTKNGMTREEFRNTVCQDHWLECTNEMGRTALHLSAIDGLFSAVDALIKAKADINARDLEGKTCLDLSSSKECRTLLKMNGADGWTRLMIAAEEGANTAIKELLSENADPASRNLQGRCAIEIAALHGHVDCVHTLLRIEKPYKVEPRKTSKRSGYKRVSFNP
jgi:ankyrin repeat protein